MNKSRPISRADQIALRHETGDTPIPVPFLSGDASKAMYSSCGKGEESHARTRRSSHTGSCCADTLHELANTMTAVLIHAQVLEWKLPPYSRLKRSVREIEHHAQSGSALLKRLLQQLQAKEEANQGLCGHVPSLHGTMAAVTAQGPNATAAETPKLPLLRLGASSRFPRERALTSLCDPCTITFFPKEER